MDWGEYIKGVEYLNRDLHVFVHLSSQWNSVLVRHYVELTLVRVFRPLGPLPTLPLHQSLRSTTLFYGFLHFLFFKFLISLHTLQTSPRHSPLRSTPPCLEQPLGLYNWHRNRTSYTMCILISNFLSHPPHFGFLPSGRLIFQDTSRLLETTPGSLSWMRF